MNERMKACVPYVMKRLGLGLLIGGAVACANMAGPNGGPYDEKPPRFVSSTPPPQQTNYKGRRVEIVFDELIQVDKPSQNVVIAPPQKELPSIQIVGRKIRVELKDTLKPNTTYTIDFGHAISDNNEKNPIGHFSFAFSTGNVIDSLEVGGVLLNAENLEPMTDVVVGLHANPSDTAFTRLPFDRTSKTDDRGRFTIRNIATGTYRLYALADANRDYRFDQPGEAIAFLDSTVTPTFRFATRQDTTWKDSVTVDTIRTVHYTHFLPDDVTLRLFKEVTQRQYMLRPGRDRADLFTLHFNAPLDSLPTVSLLDGARRNAPWFLTQPMAGRTAVRYWITDSAVWTRDTVHLRVDYLKSDSTNTLRPQTDTLHLVWRKPRARRKSKDSENKPEHRPLVFQSNASGMVEVTDTVAFLFEEPMTDLRREDFRLEQQVDTVWTPVEFALEQDSMDLLKYNLRHAWAYGANYRIAVDSARLRSIYGHTNDAYESAFSIRKREDYGHLYINIDGIDTTAFVELLNTSDEPLRRVRVKDGGVLFANLQPATYYARLTVDTNANDRWDTGDYATHRQPEMVYYSPKEYVIRANWEIEETWAPRALPLDRQKPIAITKNKPKDETPKKRNYKDEGRSGDRNRSGGFPF